MKEGIEVMNPWQAAQLIASHLGASKDT
jgi:hypothetical protein